MANNQQTNIDFSRASEAEGAQLIGQVDQGLTGGPTTQYSEQEIAYVAYWKRRDEFVNLAHTKLAVWDGVVDWIDEERKVSKWDMSLDWERYVLLREAVAKHCERSKKLPSARIPKKRTMTIQTRNSGPIEVAAAYYTYFEGVGENKQPEDYFSESLSLTNYDERTHFKFTYGNMEAALRMTKHIWKPRLSKGRSAKKNNWHYIITPICWELLSSIQTELNGWSQAMCDKIDHIQEGNERQWEGEVETESDPEPEEKVEEIVETPVFVLEAKELATPEVVVIQEEDMIITTSEGEETTYGKEEYKEVIPELVKISENFEEILNQFEEVPKEYPEIKTRTMQYEIHGSYWNDLATVYMRIGRPDLAAKQSGYVRNVWTYRKAWNINMQKYEEGAILNAFQKQWSKKRHWKAEADDQAVAMECVDDKKRNAALRLLSSYLPLILRHVDKMEVLCHRGRFAYLKTWDLALFQKQKNAIKTMDEQAIIRHKYGFEHWKYDSGMPRSYPEQANWVSMRIQAAIELRTGQKIWSACDALLRLIGDWRNHTFDPRRCECGMAERSNCRWIPQADDQPKLGAAPGGGASTDPVAKGKSSAPVKSGEKTTTITMVDEREKKTSKAVDSKDSTEPRDAEAEAQYQIAQMVKRPMLIDRFTWSTADELGKELKSYVLPQVYFSAQVKTPTVCQNLVASYQLSQFGATKFNLKVEFRINCTKFQQGMLLVVFKPYYHKARSEDILHNLQQFQHIEIDASTSNVASMIIPWTHFRDMFPIYVDAHKEFSYFGTLHVYVWNPLQTGQSGSTDATMTMWMGIENLKLAQLCNPKNPGSVNFATTIRGDVQDGKQILMHDEPKKITGVSVWTAYAGETLLGAATGIVSDIGANLVEGVLQNILPGTKHSKPNAAMPPPPVKIEVMPNSSWAKGPDLATVMSLDPLEAVKPTDETVKKVGLDYFLKLWSRVAVVEWRTQDSVNARIAHFPVMPMLPAVLPTESKQLDVASIIPTTDTCILSTKINTMYVKKRYGTMLDYLSRAFMFWKGNIKFKFQIVKTNMHSGRLMIRYEPFGTLTTAKEECQKMATPSVVWDVMEKQELEFEAQFSTVQDWLLTQFVSGNAVTTDNLYHYASGPIEMTVVNQLKVTTGIASSVQINVYISAGDNFKFKWLSPLDGVMSVRSNITDFGTVSDDNLDWLKNIQLSLQYYLAAPLVLKWADTLDIGVKGEKYRVARNAVYGPFLGRTDKEIDYNEFAENVKEILKQMEVGKQLGDHMKLLPEFDTVEKAYQWLRSFRRVYYTQDIVNFYKNRNYYWTYVQEQQLLWWMAVACLREKAFYLTKCPKCDPTVIVLQLPSEQWTPQASDTKKGVQVLHGSGDVSVNKYESGSTEYMDMYKDLQRYTMWCTHTLPPNLSLSHNDNFIKYKYHEQLFKQVGMMSGYELQNYWFEMQIPVTPFVPFQTIGEPFHTFTKSGVEYSTRVQGENTLAYTFGKADIGKDVSLSMKRYFAELFTFWRGSLRYRIEFPETTDPSGKPWRAIAVYHPRNFSDYNDIFNFNLVHGERVRSLSNMGMALFSGQVMNTLDIQIPYTSVYKKLVIDSSITDQTTSMGTLSLFIPVRRYGNDLGKCNVLAKDVGLHGCTFNIWTAVGDDFQFMVPRAACVQYLWPTFYSKTAAIDELTKGYDAVDVKTSKEEHDQPPQFPGGVKFELNDKANLIVDVENPIRCLTIMKPITRRSLTSKPSMPTKETQDILQGFTWTNGIPKSTKKWSPQAGDEPFPGPSHKLQDSEDVVTEQMSEGEETKVKLTVEIGSDKQLQEDPSLDDVDGAIQSILQTSKQIPGALEDFRNVVAAANGTFEELKKTISVLGESVVTMKEGTVKATESINVTSSTVNNVVSYAFDGIRVAIFFKGLIDMMKAEDWSERWIPLAQCAVALGIAADVVINAGKWLMSSFSSIFGSEKVPENPIIPQSFEEMWDKSWWAFVEDHSSTFRLIAAGIITIITFYFTSKAPAHLAVSKFTGNMITKLRNFSIVAGAIKSLDWLFKWIAETITTACITVGDWVSGGMITASRMSTYYPEIIEWLKKVEEYKTTECRSRVAWDIDARLAMWKLMDEGDAFIEKINSKTGNLYNTISRGMCVLQAAHNAAINSIEAPPFREDPFHISLYGVQNMGKSSILQFILTFIADRAGFPKKHRWFTRGEDDEYWSNYTGQPVVMIDDLFQDKKARAIKELIKMKTNVNYPLNMAAIEDKGRSFMSKLIGTTTNVPFPKPDDINYPPALWRRRNILAKVTAVDHIHGKVPDWSQLRFALVQPDPETEQEIVIQSGLTMTQFMCVAAEAFLLYHGQQTALVFSSLHGKQIQLPDYGDEHNGEISTAETVCDLVKNALLKGMPVAEKVIENWAKELTEDQWAEYMCNSKLSAKISKFLPAPIVQKQEQRLVKLQWEMLKFAVLGQNLATIENHIDLMKKAGCIDEVEDSSSTDWFYWPKFGETRDTSIGCIRVNNRDTSRPQWTWEEPLRPHAGETFFECDQESMQSLAEEALEIKKRLSTGLEDLIKTCAKQPPRGKVLRLADEREIRDFVTAHMHCKTADETTRRIQEVSRIFEESANLPQDKAEFVQKAKDQYGLLFTPEHLQYWKEVVNPVTKGKEWKWVVDDATLLNNEKLMEAYMVWECMEHTLDKKQIRDYKDACKEKKTIEDVLFIKVVKQQFKTVTEKATTWLDSHPIIKTALKVGFGLAALFAGYKLLSVVCPTIIAKFKEAIGWVLGWKVVQDGSAYLKNKAIAFRSGGLKAAENIRNKTREYYDWVKGLMIGSGDPDLIEAASDESAVKMFAESLNMSVKESKKVLAMRQAEAKRVPNAYYLGQDRLNAHANDELKDKKLPWFRPEGSVDPNATMLRDNVLQKNLVRLMWSNNERIVKMNGLFIDGRKLLLPKHFWRHAVEGQMFSITTLQGCEYWDHYEAKRNYAFEDHDVCVFEGSIRLPQFKKVTQNFISNLETNLRYTPAHLVVPTMALTTNTIAVMAAMVTHIEYNYDGVEYKNQTGWEYEVASSNGDCGAVLLANNTSLRGKLLGIHVCGIDGQDYGGACLVTKEMLEEATKALEPISNVKATPIVPESLLKKGVNSMKVKPEGNFMLWGAVESSKETKLPHKTEIEPSFIHDMVREHVTEPAVLTANDPRNESGKAPLCKAISKYGKVTTPFPPKDVRYVIDDIKHEVNSWPITMKARKLTDHEAVFGHEWCEYLERMNLASSPGYPWVLRRPAFEKGKAWLYDVNSEDGIADQEYRDCYQQREKLAKAGIRKVSLWTDCLKDERRPIAKIKAGKTRAFMLGPSDFTQLCRKYMGAFCANFYFNHIKSFSAIGIDPYSYEWTRVVNKLKANSSLGFGGDFHSFDGILDPELIWATCKVINAWYEKFDEDWDPEDNLVREVLFEEMIYSVHICMNSIYSKFQGNPSGNPLTTIINTIGHYCYMKLAWLELAREQGLWEYLNLKSFHQNVKGIFYGDDGLLSVKYDVVKWFNLEEVSKVLARHNIEYTSEAKTEELYGVRKITACTFLKNGFKQLKGTKLWTAPIAEDTIYELTNWVRKSDDPIGQMKQNLGCAEDFAFHHGREFYDRFGAAVNAALRERGLREIAFSYDVMMDQFLTKCK